MRRPLTNREKSLLELLSDGPLPLITVMRTHRYGKAMINLLWNNGLLLAKNIGFRECEITTSDAGNLAIGKPIGDGNVREPESDAAVSGKSEVGLETAECDDVRLRGGVRGVESTDATAPITNA